MKILIVQEYYYPYVGGIENLFKILAEKLTERGHQVYVITSKFEKILPEYSFENVVYFPEYLCWPKSF